MEWATDDQVWRRLHVHAQRGGMPDPAQRSPPQIPACQGPEDGGESIVPATP